MLIKQAKISIKIPTLQTAGHRVGNIGNGIRKTFSNMC